MTLEQIARDERELVTAWPDDSIVNAAKLMSENKVGCIIIERDNEPIGIVTDRDLTVEVIAKGLDPETTSVSDVMTRDPVTAHKDTGVYQLSQRMREHGVRRMPIVDDRGELAGIVALDDIFVLLADEMHGLSKVVRAESPPY